MYVYIYIVYRFLAQTGPKMLFFLAGFRTLVNHEDRCLKVSPDCFEPESDGKIYFYRRNCVPTFDECTHTSSSYATQMQNFWWFTRDRYLCNEYMHNMYFGDISDPDSNPKCLRLENQKVWFSNSPTPFHISKKSTERFRVAFHDVTGPYGQVGHWNILKLVTTVTFLVVYHYLGLEFCPPEDSLSTRYFPPISFIFRLRTGTSYHNVLVTTPQIPSNSGSEFFPSLWWVCGTMNFPQ